MMCFFVDVADEANGIGGVGTKMKTLPVFGIEIQNDGIGSDIDNGNFLHGLLFPPGVVGPFAEQRKPL